MVGEGIGDEALAGARGAGDEDLLVFVDPAAGGELADHGLVKLPAGRIVVRQTGEAESDANLATPYSGCSTNWRDDWDRILG